MKTEQKNTKMDKAMKVATMAFKNGFFNNDMAMNFMKAAETWMTEEQVDEWAARVENDAKKC